MFTNWIDESMIIVPPAREKHFTHSGRPEKAEFVLKDVDGVMELVQVGSSNLYDYIQSHKDSVDINKMLERYKEGDPTALDRVRAQYLDIVGAPETLADMYSFVRNTTAYFESLPLEVREQYDHNVSNFVSDIGSDHYNQLFQLKTSDVEKIVPTKELKPVIDDRKEKFVESEEKIDA